MKTVILGPPPNELAALIARRRALGQDLFDEVWKGEYHMVPAPRMSHGIIDNDLAVLLAPYAERAGLIGVGPFNLGDRHDYRVPDRGYVLEPSTAVYAPSAVVVVEIVSPDDETYEKFGFYAQHDVEEVIVVDPSAREVHCYRRAFGDFLEQEESSRLKISAEKIRAGISWP